MSLFLECCMLGKSTSPLSNAMSGILYIQSILCNSSTLFKFEAHRLYKLCLEQVKFLGLSIMPYWKDTYLITFKFAFPHILNHGISHFSQGVEMSKSENYIARINP